MSKIHIPVIEAFKNKLPKKLNNTESTGDKLFLFGNCIAKWKDNKIYISDGNYRLTNTTKDRLSMLGAWTSSRKGVYYKDGVQWNGHWIEINTKPVEIKKTLWT